MDTLAKKNFHERDSHIIFDEGPHIYTVDGDSDYLSVTTWNHMHFEPFDADKVIANMRNRKKWKQSKYYGMTPEEIKSGWEKNRDEAANAGTKMHYDIECFYNNIEVSNNSTEYQHFQNFHNDNKNLVPYRTEWMIWDKSLKFAGSIDMVFENEDGTLMIYDWKRCKQIIKAPQFNKYSVTKCIDHIPDTNFWHYSLQLNTYKAILEKNYGKTISHLKLVCLHPNKDKYQVISVPDLQEEVKNLFHLRKEHMDKNI